MILVTLVLSLMKDKQVFWKWFGILTVLFFSFLYLYSFRYKFQRTYEQKYSRNLFDNSQWRIPESKRGIGDELLYQVASYELVNHWRYFEINPEVPPLGKYFYGASILLLKNAFWANIPVFLFSIWVFYLLAKEILKKEWQQNLALFLFITQPVFFTQLNTTMFDLPQLGALLVHALAISKLLASPKQRASYILLAGVSAGAFVSLKIGYLILFIFLVDGFFLLRQKKWQSLLIIILTAGLIYPLTYLPYFLQGNSLLEFIKSQLWILHFYADSKVKVDPLLMPTAFFSGYYRGWSDNASWTRSEHWSLAWPILVLLITINWLKSQPLFKLKVNSSQAYLGVLFGAIMFAYWLIPFWTRYLILTIPFLILVSVNCLKKPLSLGVILLITISLGQLPFALRSHPEPIASHLTNLWERGSYLDLYTYLNLPQTESQRFAFAKSLEGEDKRKKIYNRQISFKLGKYNILSNKIPMTIQINSKISYSYLVRKENQWFLEWSPSLFSIK